MNVLQNKTETCETVQITGNFHVHIQLKCCYKSESYNAGF